ncbi:MAG: nuclear transport factor 2 family protein, partial [Bdellovibrionota bacterium]
MNVDRVEIEEVVRDYFQGYLSAQAALVAKAFHPETRLLSVEGGKLERTEMPEWLENLENRLRE